MTRPRSTIVSVDLSGDSYARRSRNCNRGVSSVPFGCWFSLSLLAEEHPRICIGEHFGELARSAGKSVPQLDEDSTVCVVAPNRWFDIARGGVSYFIDFD